MRATGRHGAVWFLDVHARTSSWKAFSGSKGPSTNILRTLGFYIGNSQYGLGQILAVFLLEQNEQYTEQDATSCFAADYRAEFTRQACGDPVQPGKSGPVPSPLPCWVMPTQPVLFGHAADEAGHQLPRWPSSLRDTGGPNAVGTLLPVISAQAGEFGQFHFPYFEALDPPGRLSCLAV